MRSQKILSGLILVTSLQAVHAASADEEVAITPYRPSVSNSAQLPVAGQLELELGGLTAQADGARRHSMPYLFKLGFSQEWGVLLGGEAMIAAHDGQGPHTRGFGDTTLVLKRAFLIQEGTALGLEFGTKLPTAKGALGSGKSDYAVNSILSQDLEQFHLDLNLNLSRLGLEEQDLSRWQSGLSSSLSTSINDNWGLTGEWAGTRRTGSKVQEQLLFAVTYSPSKRLTIDAGVIKRISGTAQDWSLFAGLVIPLAKLW